ncbi:MAG: hypothetical protein F4010_00085 [Cenarchaeum sp. SB0669_bin_11]|nr:hypothetical protein [Cenarchaeum sp. SB0669_bin_11]
MQLPIQVENLMQQMGYVIGAVVTGGIALLLVLIQGRNEAKRAALATSASLVTAARAESRKRVIESVENLWCSINRARLNYWSISFMHSNWTLERIADFFQGKRDESGSLESSLEQFKDLKFTVKQKQLFEEGLNETEVLHVSPRLWTLYNAIVAARSQLGVLTFLSFQGEQYIDWRTNEIMLSALKGNIEGEDIESPKSVATDDFEEIVAWLEAEFIKEGSRLIQGSKEFAHSVQETYIALLRRNESATESLVTRS